MRTIFSLTMILFLLTACGAAAQPTAPTVTAAIPPTPSATATSTLIPTPTSSPTPRPLPEGFTELVEKLIGSYEFRWSEEDKSKIVLVDTKTGNQIPEIIFGKEGNWSRTYTFENPAGEEEPLAVNGTLNEIKIVEVDGEKVFDFSAWEIKDGVWTRKTVDHTDPKTEEEIILDIPELSAIEFMQLLREKTKAARETTADGSIPKELTKMNATKAREFWGLKSQYDWTINYNGIQFQMYIPEERTYPPYIWNDKIYIGQPTGIDLEEPTIAFVFTSVDAQGKNGFITIADGNSYFVDVDKLNTYGVNWKEQVADPNYTPFRID